MSMRLSGKIRLNILQAQQKQMVPRWGINMDNKKI